MTIQMNVRNHSPGFAYIFRPEFHSFLYNIIHTIVIHNFFFKRIIIKFGKYFCFIWQNGKYFWQHFLEGKIWMIFNVVVDNNIWEDDFWGDWCFDFLKERNLIGYNFRRELGLFSWNQFHKINFVKSISRKKISSYWFHENFARWAGYLGSCNENANFVVMTMKMMFTLTTMMNPF